VGIKPTVGLTSRAGVIPIAHSQDTVGSFGRTVTDAAIVLGTITGVDPHDPTTQGAHFHDDYTKFLDADGLKGARIGVCRQLYFGYHAQTDALINAGIERMAALGATIIDHADIPTAQQMSSSESELQVLLYEFKADLNAYLSELTESPVRSLAEIISFNDAHAEQEQPYFGQNLLQQAQATTDLNDPLYLNALAENRRLARQDGIDAVMDAHKLDALVMPTRGPAWCIDWINGDHDIGGSAQAAALAGYPAISVPAGFVLGLPIGMTLMGRAYSEPTLIKLAYAFEQATKQRRPPQFLPTLK